MTRRTYANISDAEIRQLRSHIAGWAFANLSPKSIEFDCAGVAAEWLRHGIRMKTPASRENAVLRAWEYFHYACAHLPRTGP